MSTSEAAHFPNPTYICYICNKNLGDKYSRLKGKKTPNATIIKGKTYCDKCADKQYDIKWFIYRKEKSCRD